ncbi:bifunctional DNA primase/polymerase [Bradyrhizobium liaoningense]|uniref:bifunctional DNA primase/polymerase n=1 Tax=Bradyrhizobium liaoningense TaxID=43992 RepID=UPI001BA537E6|nr:bifunctional DNA primase/polymerase [Bradyrhizobium liaoningense]MBR0876894.1 bifunctional DNA primase/polymerase [Bradyrhizobium liaoningense]
MKHINTPALSAFHPDRWTLIPLYRYDHVSELRGRTMKDGKRPRHKDWQRRDYSTRATIKECADSNSNIGVRLRADQLVIDVDPRNGGDDGWTDLCLELGIKEESFPSVTTGSGGKHFYCSKPADVPVLDTLKDFPGVEFKSKGRQVVAPGSIHPDTQDFYVWDDNGVPLASLPPCPTNLLTLITRPQRSALTTGGQYTPEQLEAFLEHIDPTQFQDEHRWRTMMMACHHATGGDARQEFINWSISDPKYSADADLIGRRWDSLHADKEKEGAAITIGTLRKLAHEEKAAHHLPVDGSAAVSDFDEFEGDEYHDDAEAEEPEPRPADTKKKKKKPADEDGDGVRPENEGGITNASLAVLTELNGQYTCAIEGSKFRVFSKEYDAGLERDYWQRLNPQDFMMLHCNRRIERDKEGLSKNAAETMPLGKAWLEWSGRNTVKGVIFAPLQTFPGYLNMWTDYAVAGSKHGSWAHLKEMTHECLCDGDDALYEYVINWLAFMIQKPNVPAESALIFHGDQGIGKGTLGNAVAHIIGRHALAVGSAEMLTGRFNSHLQDILFLFADEAVKPYDKAAANKLKHLITEKRITIEGKGRDAVEARNIIHIMMASNENWIIEAARNERRYVVANANAKWMGKTDKWDALHHEMEHGGYDRMMFELKTMNLGDFHPRKIVKTAAYSEQIKRSFTPIQMYLFNACFDGIWPTPLVEAAQWEREPIRFFAEDFRTFFRAWAKDNGINPAANGRGNNQFLTKDFKDVFPQAKTELRAVVPDDSTVTPAPSDGRAQCFEIPSLADCRAAFDKAVHFTNAWNPTGEASADDFDFN